jgi:hypothetical protein
MAHFEPITYEEIQERFFSVFHRDMTRDERQCFLLVDKYWISGYFLGIADGANRGALGGLAPDSHILNGQSFFNRVDGLN